MVSRKSKPVVTRIALSSGTLANNIDQSLMKFQVAADSAGSISLKQVIFSLSKTSGVALSNLKISKAGTDMNAADYAISFASSTGSNVVDAENGTIVTGSGSGFLIVSFTGEESISGSGNVYTLHGLASVTGSSQSVSVAFLRDTSNAIVTGYLASNSGTGVIPASTDIYNIDTAAAAEGGADATGTFLWSDQSEVPHSSAVGTAGSRDWTNDVYVEQLSETQTLSAS